MPIRSSSTTRNLEARKSSIPTIGKGKPLDARGSEGDIAFRRTSEGLKLYIKANHKWHGIKVGESFDSLEKKVNEIKSKVETMKQFRLPSTYSVTGDFTLDASGDITLNADGGQVAIKDDTATHFKLDCDNTRFVMYDDQDAADLFSIQIAEHGATTISTVDDGADIAHLTLDADGDIYLDAVLANSSDSIGLKNAGTTFAAFQIHHSASFLYLYENGGASTSDYLSFKVEADGVSTIATNDGAGADAHLEISADGNIVLNAEGDIEINADGSTIALKDASQSILTVEGGANPSLTMQSLTYGDVFRISLANSGEVTLGTTDFDAAAGGIVLDADGDVTLDAASGNIICLDNGSTYTPSASNHVANKGYVDATHKWHFNTGSRWYTRYDNWYFPSTTYGINSVNWSSSLSSPILPIAWNDAYNPCIVVPQDCKINSYHFYGNFTSSQTYQVALMTGTPSYGSAGNTTLSQIGATQELAATASIYNKLEQTGLSASLSAGDIIIPCLRRTTTDTSTYYYFEFAMNIVGTLSA